MVKFQSESWQAQDPVFQFKSKGRMMMMMMMMMSSSQLNSQAGGVSPCIKRVSLLFCPCLQLIRQGPPTLVGANSFTQSTNLDVNLTDTPRAMFDRISGYPVGWSS